MRPQIFRMGDRARIVIPSFVKRVGYPKTVEDYLPQVDASGEVDALLERFLKRRKPFKGWGGTDRKVASKIRHDLAYLLAQEDGFGGPDRTLHQFDVPELEGCECEVLGVRTVHTGRYHAPYQSVSFEGEYDYYPGGLSNEKRYRLARVDVNAWANVEDRLSPFMITEIAVDHLEKL